MTNPAPNPANILSIYDSLYAACNDTFAEWKRAWYKHVDAVNLLKDSNSWEPHVPTDVKTDRWGVFCALYLPFKRSAYSERKAFVPFAQTALRVANATLKPEDCRKLKKRLVSICHDSELIHETYEIAVQKTDNPLPTEGELQAVYSTLHKVKHTGTVTVNGVDRKIENIAIDLEIVENLRELEMRRDEHRNAGKPKPYESTIEVIQWFGKARAVIFLPDDIEASSVGKPVKIYEKKAREE